MIQTWKALDIISTVKVSLGVNLFCHILKHLVSTAAFVPFVSQHYIIYKGFMLQEYAI